MYPENYNTYSQNFGYNELNYRHNDINQMLVNDELITFNDAIMLIKSSISDEKEDELFYDMIIKQAPTEKEKNIIKSIRDDEIKHNQILRKLYFDFTGQILPLENFMTSETSKLSYIENLEKSLFGEINAIKKYRKILSVMPSGNSYALLMSIMTDEITHADKYNFLLNIAK